VSISDAHYLTLELPPGSSREEVKRAYREMAKTYHPDLYPYDDVSRLSCVQKMQGINEAYEFLRDFAPDETEEGFTPPEPPKAQPEKTEEDPEPDLAAKYGAHTAEEPWPEPEPAVEDEPAITRFDPEAARRQEAKNRSAWSPLRHGLNIGEPDFPGLFQVAATFSAAILTLLSLYVLDITAVEGYFRSMRVIVCLACLHAVYYAACRGYWEISMACFLIALALNPAVPLRMALEGWWIFNALCPLLMIFLWVVMFNRESDRALGIKRRD
jgi:hypothetical protein